MFLFNMGCCGKVISAIVLSSVKDTLNHVAVLLNWCEPPSEDSLVQSQVSKGIRCI